jgi:TetR/AcrR family transcriptional regulator, cholesterol catabolism regulator
MGVTAGPESRDAVLDVVVEILETDGYDSVRVRDVARGARVSSKSIYKMFESRDELIVTAIERWMATSIYERFTAPEVDDSLCDSTMRMLRAVFGPWEEHPRMLEAWYRTRSGAGLQRLTLQGNAAARRVGESLLEQQDPALARDLEEILSNVVLGLISRFVHGEIAVTQIMPTVERAVVRLTTPVRAERLA